MDILFSVFMSFRLVVNNILICISDDVESIPAVNSQHRILLSDIFILTASYTLLQ